MKPVLFVLFALLLPLSAQARDNDWLYSIRLGDTLWDLCIRYTHKRGCWIELAKYNRIKHDRRIPPGTVVRVPFQWLKNVPQVGVVETVQGQVFLKRNVEDEEIPLTQGQALYLGSHVRSAQGTALLRFSGGNMLRIRPMTTMLLDEMSSLDKPHAGTELDVSAGSVEASVREGARARFRIKTPAAIASVRGTRYRVTALAQEDVTRSEVLKGKIAFGSSKMVGVSAGYGVSAKVGEAPQKPKALLPPPVIEAGALYLPKPAMLTWDAHPDARAWQADVYPQAPKSPLQLSRRVEIPEIAFSELDAGCYRLELSTIDDAGFRGTERHVPLCIIEPLASVEGVVATPAKNDTAELVWQPVTGANAYRVALAKDPDFEHVLWSVDVSADSQRVMLPALVDSRGYVKIVPVDQHGNVGQEGTATYTTEKIDWPAVFSMAVLVLVSIF